MLAAVLTAWGALRGITGGISLKGIGIALAVAVALGVAWTGVSFARQAASDHAAVAVLAGQRDEAVRAANSNAAAMTEARARREAGRVGAQAAAASASARSAALADDLESLRHAPRSACTPTAADRDLLLRLR